jgi:biotin/methionine sulfoxide reductase
MLAAIPAMVHSPLRIKRPAVRKGWRERRERTGADEFFEVSWDTALDLVVSELSRVRGRFGAEAIFGGSYGWSSAGRLHHARSLVRRFLFLGGGCVDQVGNYSWGAAQFLLPHVIGTYQPVTGRVTDWPSLVKHTQLVIAFGGLALKKRTDHLRRHRGALVGSLATPGQTGEHRIRRAESAEIGLP